MTAIRIIKGLPFVAVTIFANDQQLLLSQVLLDTGSTSTIFKTDLMEQIGVKPGLTDKVVFIRGIAGTEPVVRKQVHSIAVDGLVVSPVTIQLGAMDYGIDRYFGYEFSVACWGIY
jgi:hypothetical protein